MANTLAYLEVTTVTAVKKFYSTGLRWQYQKTGFPIPRRQYQQEYLSGASTRASLIITGQGRGQTNGESYGALAWRPRVKVRVGQHNLLSPCRQY